MATKRPDARRASIEKAPAQLKGIGRKIWQRLVAIVAPMSFVRTQDRDALERYCEHLAEFWKLTTEIRGKGLVYRIKSRHGTYLRPNPRVAIRDRIEGRLVDLEDRFGLNPRARQQIIAQLAGLNMQHPGGDLFGGEPAGVAPQPAESPPAADGIKSPIGFLN